MKAYLFVFILMIFIGCDSIAAPTHHFEYSAKILDFAFSPDSGTLAVLIDGGTIHVHNVVAGSEQWQAAASNQTSSIQFSPDSRRLYSVSAEGSVSVWSAATGRLHYTWHARDVPQFNFFRTAALSPDGRHFVIAGGKDWRRWLDSNHGLVSVWDRAAGFVRHTVTFPPLLEIAFAPDGHTLALTGGMDSCSRGGGGTALFDSLTGAFSGYTLSRHGGSVGSVQFTTDGQYLIGSGSAQRCFGGWAMWIWNFETRELYAELLDYGAPLAVHESTLAAVQCLRYIPNTTTCELQQLVLRDIPGQQSAPIANSQAADYTALAFSPDGKWLVAGTSTGEIVMWLIA